MMWMRRIAYFIGLNIVVAITISFILNVLGIQPYLSNRGLNIPVMFTFCLVWGMGGAFISLLASKMTAKWLMGVKIIDPNTSQYQERQLLDTVHRLAAAAQLPKMPEVGIYPSEEINAFATGPTKSNSLVAVSAGLLNAMDQRSLDGVLGHEITHISNGDMVTMTLLQGVVNAFVYFLARLMAFAIDNALRGDRDDRGGLGFMGRWLVTMILEMLLFIPGSMIIAMFSRMREYRADEGGARLAGRANMIAALRSLQRLAAVNEAPERQQERQAPAIAALKISGARSNWLAALGATHPPLADRIARLESAAQTGSVGAR